MKSARQKVDHFIMSHKGEPWGTVIEYTHYKLWNTVWCDVRFPTRELTKSVTDEIYTSLEVYIQKLSQ